MSTGKVDHAAQIIDRIIADMRSRGWFDDEWALSEEVRDEVRAAWIGIATDVIKVRDLRVGADERAHIRFQLVDWLIGRVDPRDAGLVNGRHIIDEINRICSKAEGL